MALTPAITDLEQLKSHPAVARLLAWNSAAVTEGKFDRDEMTITVDRSCIREACALLAGRCGLRLQLSFRCDLRGLVSGRAPV